MLRKLTVASDIQFTLRENHNKLKAVCKDQ